MDDGRGRPERPVFCGNFEYDAPEKAIMDLFEKYGRVHRIDMKTGFAFVYMESESEANRAIRNLDRMEFGYKRRPLRVEWAKKMEVSNKNQVPTTTLFVVNFDVRKAREGDIETFFDRYGPLNRVEIKRNYAFVEFKELDDAIDAQKKTHGTNFDGRTITVEFVESSRLGKDRDRSRSPPGGYRRRSPSPRGRSPPRRGYSPRGHSPRRRSPSPARRQRSRSPDYGRGGRGGRSGSPPRGRSPRRSRSPRP